jgi:2-polyprenyl-6-methoxyphenol hydroxylase-like FAD-dependent oxidoreductase
MRKMRKSVGQRAVVIGAGMGGLSAAGALARSFEQVVILERDLLTPVVEVRPGVPQGAHVHGLLAGGLKALAEIFPGYRQELLGAGAVTIELGKDIRHERPDVGLLPQRDLGLSLLCASRPLIEAVLRRQVEALANVELRSGRVTEILPTASKEAVHGVRFDTRSGGSETLEADLVVDASGRGAFTMAFLGLLDLEWPDITEVGVDVTYSTTVVELPALRSESWKAVFTLPDPPRLAMNAALVQIEGNRWMVSIGRRGAAERLDNWEKFVSACRGLITPTIYNALRRARPVEGIRHYAVPTSSWSHFERLSFMPRGLLPIADALCRFNPLYGQGMASAAQQARLLQNILQQTAAAADPIAALQAGFMAEVGSVLETPWAMSTGADLAFPETRGVRPENFEESIQFEAALFRAVVVDPVVHKAMMEVAQLLQPGSLLRAPHIMERIEAAGADALA